MKLKRPHEGLIALLQASVCLSYFLLGTVFYMASATQANLMIALGLAIGLTSLVTQKNKLKIAVGFCLMMLASFLMYW